MTRSSLEQRLSTLTLHNVEISTIRPFEKTDHPAFLEPSILDTAAGDMYYPFLFLYKPEGVESDAFKLADNLKTSLSKVLVSFYPFAGNWVKINDTRKRLLLCTDQGVPFIEASINEDMQSVVDVTDFQAVEELGGHRLMGLDPTVHKQTLDSPMPSLFVQLTRFKCGSVALQFNLHHMTTDAIGSSIFLEALSQVVLQGRTSIVPIHDRSLITPPNLDVNESAAGDDTSSTSYEKGLDLTPAVDKTLYVRRDVITDLKKAADTSMVVSTTDLVTAHLWRSVNNLRNSGSTEKDRSATVYSALNMRNRFYPPLPEQYVGNAYIMAALPETPLTEPSWTHSQLISTAHVFGQTVKAINSSTWQDVLAKSFRSMGQKLGAANSENLFVSSAIRYPSEKLCFGSGFGKPIFAGANPSIRHLPRTGWQFSIFPSPPALSKVVVASIQMVVPTCAVAKALFSNDNFLSFFHSTRSAAARGHL